MTIKERLATIETELRFIKKFLYGLLLITGGSEVFAYLI